MTISSTLSRQVTLLRRDVLRGSLALPALVTGTGLFSTPAHAAPATPLVKRVSRSPEDTYYTYPHSNGFLPDGRAIVARPIKDASGPGVEYIAFNLATGASASVAKVSNALMYYAIARNGVMAVPTNAGGVVVVDLTRGTQTQIMHDPAWIVNADLDITKDGSKVLVTMEHRGAPASSRTAIITLATGALTTVSDAWPMDHAHFSPYDESWVCYADNRQPNHDRMWVWNATQAPKGRHVFNQQMPNGWLEVGHERAMFNKPALVTIAYGESAGSPRGLYEVDFSGSARLVSESNCDLHCNISPDGRWAVVTCEGAITDDTGKIDFQHRPTAGWLRTGGNYGYSDVMIVNMKTGARRFLYRGTNDVNHQPYEVQPSVSPDGRWVLIKDAKERRVLALELDQPAVTSFLA